MIKSFKFRPAYCFMLTSALILGACSLDGGRTYNADSSEDLLAAEGEWKLVEEKRTPEPMQKHMDTRDKVNPAQLSKSRSYTDTKKSLHIDEDIHFRVLRLERQMQNVRGDLDQIIPRMASIPMPEKKPAMPQKAAPKPAMKKAAAPAKKAVKKAMGGPLRVVGVRTGLHPGKVRFVLDVSSKPTFSYDLDNGEGLLLVELPGTGWDAASQKSFGKNPLVSSYSVQQADDGGSRLVIALKKPVKVGMAKAFLPNHVHGHRVVFDLAAE